ncbi:hypothetical protein TWF788_005388 [Orbilia oligospora]|uniref:Uncharacterized protein n=1 Tax=Orbilia oligospora TaxID=2813651 RepID=A0A7C8TWV0_ORBOL|nr:hypothetical protein TWF788_005388 [Orbilia oligospora]
MISIDIQPILKPQFEVFKGHLGNLVVKTPCKYHELAVKDSESENREALSSGSLVNFLVKSTLKEVERVSRNELKPGDYARLNDFKLIRERNALAHENWGKLAMILESREYSMHKQKYSRIFAWVVKSSIEEAAAEYASQRRNPEN